MAQLEDLPDYVKVVGKIVQVQTFAQAVEVSEILGDDNTYGIQVVDPVEEQKLIQMLFGGSP